jgi:hypothetical protein
MGNRLGMDAVGKRKLMKCGEWNLGCSPYLVPAPTICSVNTWFSYNYFVTYEICSGKV